MNRMFRTLISMSRLNLSGWDVSNVVNMENMFDKSTALTDIIYSKTMTSQVYGKFLSLLANPLTALKDNGNLHVGSNTCGSDSACLSDKATLEGKGWTFVTN
jgi:surface protein